MTWHELVFDLITLWVTIDPIGTLPIYLSVTKGMSVARRKTVAFRASIIAFAILTGFLYLGHHLLAAMRIELLSFQISGGIVLFLFALTMIFEKESAAKDPPSDAADDLTRDVAVFPLAMPSIATPGAILTVVVLTGNNTDSFFEQTVTCGVMLLVLAVNLVLMLIGNRIVALMGRAGLNVLSRVMGMILAAAAVQMVYSGVRGQLGPG